MRSRASFSTWSCARCAAPPAAITVEHALSRVIAIVGITLSLLTALSTMGVDINALIAALGLTSLAIGLALKDTIENAITGVLLLIQRPFKVGDVIQVASVTGTVADVAIRTTKIKSVDGLHVLIPNRHVYDAVITNWSYYPHAARDHDGGRGLRNGSGASLSGLE